ncbi:hypothetical protein AERO8C_160264 [Aeromonas veronii]|uniref:Uncharacterized protein n=1 Tax=Aeromonas veronii TaxID=654 RepID=A0A653KZV0_AERVE|nr:hypothetical protein AERO8C_160264 [Aeromonas veronii]
MAKIHRYHLHVPLQICSEASYFEELTRVVVYRNSPYMLLLTEVPVLLCPKDYWLRNEAGG